MNLDFYPWVINTDNNNEINYSEDSIFFEANTNYIQKFHSILTDKQLQFFEKLGVNIELLHVDCHTIHSNEVFETRFLIPGNFISIPSFQMNTYLNIDSFDNSILDKLNVTEVSEKDMLNNQIDNMQYSFKHPIIYSDNKDYQKWDCGYVCVVVILKHPITNK